MKKMKIIIKGNNIKINESLKKYINEKIGRLSKYYDRLQSAEVELLRQDNRSAEESQRVEVTLIADGAIFRCEEMSISMYASIDIVSEKLERQLRRYKQKLISKGRKTARKDDTIDYEETSIDEDAAEIAVQGDDSIDPQIVKVKRFAVKPMTPHEASLQMEMLNHNFFVFLNDNTEQVNVIYKRGDGDYGLIEPDFS